MGIFGSRFNAKGAASPRTFWGDVGKAVNDSLAAQYDWKTGGPLNLGNDFNAAGKLFGGVIDAGGAFAGRHVYDLNPRAYSDAIGTMMAIPNDNSTIPMPVDTEALLRPKPMLTRQDAEKHGEIAANAASLFTPAGPEDAAAEGVRFAPASTDFAVDTGRSMLRPLNNAVRDATSAVLNKPAHLLPPRAEADRLLYGAIRKDTRGAVDPIVAGADKWRQTGASGPSLADAATTLPNLGQNVMGLTRAAATKGGEAARAAMAHRTDVAGLFPSNVRRLTQGLTPDTRSAGEVLAELGQAQADGRPTQDAIDSLNSGLTADLYDPKTTFADKTYGGIGLRQNLIDRFKASASIDPDVLLQITHGGETPNILGGTFGGEAAANYRAALVNEQQRLRNADSIASAVPVRELDVGSGARRLVSGVPTTPQAGTGFALGNFIKGLGLNPEEGEAVVNRASRAFDPDWLTSQAQAQQAARNAVAAGTQAGLGAGVVSNAVSAAPPRMQAAPPPPDDSQSSGASWPPFPLQ